MSLHDLIEDTDPSNDQLLAETLNKIQTILKKNQTPDVQQDLKTFPASKWKESHIYDIEGPKPVLSLGGADTNQYFDMKDLLGYIRTVPEIPVPCPLVETLTDTGISFSTGIVGASPADFSKKFGGGAKFNGSSYIRVDDHAILNVTDEIGLAGWLYIPAGLNSGDIIRKNNQYQLYISAANTLAWRVYSGGAWKTAVDMSFVDDAWFHVAATYKSASSGQKIYKDGTLQDSDSETGAIATSTNKLGIANDGAGASVLGANSRLAWLSLLHKELGSSWITDHVNGRLNTRDAPEIVTYPFTVNAKYETDMHPGNWIPH